MDRIYKMTAIGSQATWCKTTCNDHIPTQWFVSGDCKEGYRISAVNDDLCGFDLITLKSLYATKRFIDQVNTTGTTDYKNHCSVGSFAWSNYPIPS